MISVLTVLATFQIVSDTTPASTVNSSPIAQTIVTGTQTLGNCGTTWTDVQNSDNLYCKYQESTTSRLLPNANGDASSWIVSGTGDCTQESNEWECVNEHPNDGDGTYIKSTASSTTDSLENLGTVSLNGATVSNVKVTIWCRKAVSQTVAVKTLVKTNGVIYAGASFNCPNSGTYGTTSTTYNTNPNTGSAWTQGEIDALQAGCRDSDTTTREVRCSEVLVEVNTNSRQSLEVRFAFSSVPITGDRWALVVECKQLVEGGGGENVLVQVGQGGNPPSSWNTAYTCNSNADTLFTTYELSTAELNNGAPVIRLWDNPGPADTVQGTMELDVLRIDRTASPPTQVGTDIRFWDDFEGGTKKWVPIVDPATNRFGVIPGDIKTGHVRQSWFFGSRNVLSMASLSSSPGVAYGLTALFSQASSYIVLMNFSVSDLAAPADPELPGAFTVYDDGYTRLKIEGIGPANDPGGRLVVYTAVVPPSPTFIQVLRFNVWYLLDIRVYPAEGMFQLFINETHKGGFGLTTSTPRGMGLLGDDSYATGTSGVALWDNIVIATLRTPPFSENFDDGNVADWVVEYTPFNTFAISMENSPPSSPNDLKVKDLSGGTAYGYSPYIDLDAPLAALPDYKVTFKFFVPTTSTPQGMIVVSDGAAHLRAENRDASSYDLKAYVSPTDIRQVAQVTKGAWHTMIAEVHRNAAPTPDYDVWIDGTKATTGPFPLVADQHYRKAPSDLILGDHTASGNAGEAFWDDFAVQFGTNVAPTLTPCYGGGVGVNPTSGVRATQTFTYCVIYADADNDAPMGGAPIVRLRKLAYPKTDEYVKMDPGPWIGSPGDYVAGRQFTHSRTWFYVGTDYKYTFLADDNMGHPVSTTETGGPTVTGCNAPILSDDFVAPKEGIAEKTIFQWGVTLTDLDNDAYVSNANPPVPPPANIRIFIDAGPQVVLATDPWDSKTDDGKGWYRSTTLSAGDHNFYFEAMDTCATVVTPTVFLPHVEPVQTPCNDDWLTFHHDMARTGVSECLAPGTSTINWRGASNGKVSDSSPTVIDRGTTDYVFIGRWDQFSVDDDLISYDTAGVSQWTYSLGPFALSTQSPTHAEGLVIIGGFDGFIRAFTEAGALRWTHDANQYNPPPICTGSAKIVGAPAVAGNAVFVSVGNRGVFLALDLQTGALKWKFSPSSCSDFLTSPTSAEGKVFVAEYQEPTTQNGKMYALPISDPNGDGILSYPSEIVWEFTSPEPDPTRRIIRSTPAVLGGAIYFGGDDGKVWAFPTNEPSGDKIMDPLEVLWFTGPYETWKAHDPSSQRGPNDKVYSSPAVHDLGGEPSQRVVFVGARRSILAIDRDFGTLLWKYIIPDPFGTIDLPIDSSPAVASELVYVRFGPKVYAVMERDVDADGVTSLVWELQVSESVYSIEQSSPAIFDGRLFVGTTPFAGNNYHIWAIKDP